MGSTYPFGPFIEAVMLTGEQGGAGGQSLPLLYFFYSLTFSGTISIFKKSLANFENFFGSPVVA